MNPIDVNKPNTVIKPEIKAKDHAIRAKVHKVKGKEFEDLQQAPLRSLKRQSSLREIHGETQALAKKNAQIWECVSRHSDLLGGYSYRFKMKPQYDDITLHPDLEARQEALREKNRAIFPAVEHLPILSTLLDPTIGRAVKKEWLIKEHVKRATIDDKLKALIETKLDVADRLIDLGYKVEATQEAFYLYLPDKEALLARWEKLRQTSPELPPLKIASSVGIADDLSFIEAFFTHDVLLSNDKEFVHDHIAHVIPMLSLQLTSNKGTNPSYKAERKRLEKMVLSRYRRLLVVKKQLQDGKVTAPKNELQILQKDIRKCEALLGGLVDLITNASDYKLTALYGNWHADFMTLERGSLWKKIWKKRFGPEGIKYGTIRSLMEGDIKKIEEDYDRLRKKQP